MELAINFPLLRFLTKPFIICFFCSVFLNKLNCVQTRCISYIIKHLQRLFCSFWCCKICIVYISSIFLLFYWHIIPPATALLLCVVSRCVMYLSCHLQAWGVYLIPLPHAGEAGDTNNTRTKQTFCF